MLSKLNNDLLIGFSLDTVHILRKGKRTVIMIQTESENSLSDASEVSQFQTIPKVYFRFIAKFRLVFFHKHDPEIELGLPSIVETLKILPYLQSLVENNRSRLISTIFYTWIVGISIVLGC